MTRHNTITLDMRNISKLLSVVLALLLLFSCDKSDSIRIVLGPNERLENTLAGYWIKQFELDYTDRHFTLLIYDELKRSGYLLDTYKEDKNVVYVWGYRDIVVDLIGIQGEVCPDVRIKLDQPGIPWAELLPNHYRSIKMDKEYVHVATIESPLDNARIFLFGGAKYCTKIYLTMGARR